MAFYHKEKENTTDVWLTPKYIIDSLGEFDLDPCCPEEMPWQTAKRSLSIGRLEDGLIIPWHGRVWLNPPYSNWVPFLKKLRGHGNGIALIYARTETNGFFDHIWGGADAILFIKGRIKFIRGKDGKIGVSTAPSVLIAYGASNVEALKECKILGKLIELKNNI